MTAILAPASIQNMTVLRHTAQAAGYEGVIICTVIREGEDPTSDGFYEVLAQNLSIDEAEKLVRQTPIESRLLAALQESTMDGKIDFENLKFNLTAVLFMSNHEGPKTMKPVIHLANKSPASALLLYALHASVIKGIVSPALLSLELSNVLDTIENSDLVFREPVKKD